MPNSEENRSGRVNQGSDPQLNYYNLVSSSSNPLEQRDREMSGYEAGSYAEDFESAADQQYQTIQQKKRQMAFYETPMSSGKANFTRT